MNGDAIHEPMNAAQDLLLDALRRAGKRGLAAWQIDDLIPGDRDNRGLDHVKVRICQLRKAAAVRIDCIPKLRGGDVGLTRYILKEGA
jgi:hypothetical protein